jgi:hypothetical protein
VICTGSPIQAFAFVHRQRLQLKKKLWSECGRAEFEKLPLGYWANRRRQELLELLDRINPTIDELTVAVEREARKRPDALRLMTHPGVGPLTALAYVLIIGTPTRFPRGKQIGTYVGMIPSEDSSDFWVWCNTGDSVPEYSPGTLRRRCHNKERAGMTGITELHRGRRKKNRKPDLRNRALRFFG